MNLLTMMFPLLCLTAMCLLVANANPTFEGYRYEKPSIAFEYPTVTKMLPKNADIKPATPMKVASEKIATKSKLNSATATKPARTMAHEQQQQQEKEKSHEIQKIEKSTVINPTAIKETNLNIKSNKNPATPTKTTTPSAKVAATTETVVKTKTDKLSLNQLPNTISSSSTSTTSSQLASAGCSVFVQQEHTKLKHKLDKYAIKKLDPLVLATQEAALENLLNRDNGYIYRLPAKENQLPSLDEILPHTQHDQHHATKRLKLKHEVSVGLDHSQNTASVKYCCEQSFASLKEKYTELSLNRPLERRLAPYQETLADKEYFE